jgi:predicted Zn-dependent protease
MSANNAKLSQADRRHLDAAEGWLGLGSWSEANEELENISARMRAHPDVLKVRYAVFAMAKHWESAAEIARAITVQTPDSSFGWIRLGDALHNLGRTKDAKDVLKEAAKKFPNEYIIFYGLACYACQLGELVNAFHFLEKAIDLAGKKDIRKVALNDPNLEPLWVNIGEI